VTTSTTASAAAGTVAKSQVTSDGYKPLTELSSMKQTIRSHWPVQSIVGAPEYYTTVSGSCEEDTLGHPPMDRLTQYFYCLVDWAAMRAEELG